MKWTSVVGVLTLLAVLTEINAIRWIKRPHNSRPAPAAAAAAAKNPCLDKRNWSIVPHAENCHEFYLCLNGAAEEYACADRQYFDKNTLTCNFGTCPSAQPDGDDNSNSTKKCKHGTTHKVEGNCYAFDHCTIKGKYKTSHCPPGFYYEHTKRLCRPVDFSTNFKCSCLMPEYTILQGETCNSYVECLNRTAETQFCARGHRFDALINSCVPDLEGKCNETPKKMILFDENVNHVCGNDNGEVSFKPHPTDCNSFVICSMGRAITKYCEKGFFYDSTTHMCRRDDKKQCRKETTKQTLFKPLVSMPLTIQQLPEVPKEPEVVEHPQAMINKPIEPLVVHKPQKPSLMQNVIHRPIIPVPMPAKQKLKKETKRDTKTNAGKEENNFEESEEHSMEEDEEDDEDTDEQSQPKPSILDSILSFFNFF